MVPRASYLDKLLTLEKADAVTIITGVRRCGKSSLLKLYAEHLIAEGVPDSQIIEINFESMAFDELTNPMELHRYVQEKVGDVGDGKRLHLLIDEVQEVERWARTVNSLKASFPVDICVTGSNSRLFAGQDLTYLSGRYVKLDMYPLSLSEFETFRMVFPSDELVPGSNVFPQSHENVFQSFLQEGSFPAVALAKDKEVRQALLEGIVDSVIMRDVVQRGGIDNEAAFRRVARFAFDNIGSFLSANKIANTLKAGGHSINPGTVDRYLELMCDAFVLYRCQRYDIKGRELLRTNPKYYVVDPGLRNAFLGERSWDLGHILENLVYLELRRRGYEVTVGRVGEKEIDLVAVAADGTVYVQVCQTLIGEEVQQREFSALEAVGDAYPKYVLSMDDLDYSRNGIKHRTIREFLEGMPL